MNKFKIKALTVLTCLALSVMMAGSAYGQLSVSKAITGVDADGDSTFEITDGAEIAAFLGNVPNSREITFEVTFTVTATGTVDNIVVTDHFGAELDATCGTPSQGSCTIDGGFGNDRLIWDVGTLIDASATLIATATTNLDPGGNQRYTSCGQHEFNSGPTAKGTVTQFIGRNGSMEHIRQVSDDGAQILLTVSGLVDTAFPQCSNCIDDDNDGLIDGEDPECTDPLDEDESVL